MAQITSTSSTLNPTEVTVSPTKSADSLRPHYYTTFQKNCCESKPDSTTVTQNKDILSIPTKLKNEAEDLLNHIHGVLIENLTKLTELTSIIPSIFFENNDNFHIQRYLIDRVMLKTMRDADIINWNSSLKQLYPIRTSGNGNCLLHAVLIAMIGIYDSNLYLRDRLAQFMDENKDVLKNHWRIERLKTDKIYGIRSEDSKLDDEWDELCKLVHYERSEDGQTATSLQFLEAVHIFSISNMLHRPIIVLSEDIIRNKNGEAISVNDLFGIYLPILSLPHECIHEPIILAYDHSHFCPLQTTDSRIEKTLDNLLPLYLSINHVYDQTLLPIRFLGDDVSAERSNNLFYDYLQIQTVKYNPDSNSTPISILCAKLSDKRLTSSDNFFLVYHKYLIDFFEVQKPKAIEEERRRRLDNYVPREISYDINSRSFIRQDPLSPLTPLRPNTSINSIQSRHPNGYSYNQPYSYDDVHNSEAYIPYNGALHVENPPTQPQQSRRSPDYTKTAKQNSNVIYYDYDPTRRLNSTNYSNNTGNLNSSGKSIDSLDIDRRINDSSLNRERTRIDIPVQVIKSSASSNNRDLFISEPTRNTTSICVICDRPFHSTQVKRICPDCYPGTQYSNSDDFGSSRPQSRSQSANMYLPAYNSSSYTTVLSPIPKKTALSRVTCPRCNNPNLVDNRSGESIHYCSSCRNPMSSLSNY